MSDRRNWWIGDEDLRVRVVRYLSSAGLGFSLTYDPSPKRTLLQNALLHKWTHEIAQQKGDETAAEIKALCNLTYGRPILDRDDPEWSAAFGYIFDQLNHAAKLKAIRVLDIPFTRKMTVDQLREYMDQMQRDYREAGFRLTQPDE